MPSSTRLHVANPPARPLVLYDGTCGFCKTWIARWRERTGDAVDYEPSQGAGARFPEIPPEDFARAVQLVLPDGSVLSGAGSVARLLSLPRGRGVFDGMYRRVPGVAPLSELAYRAVAGHRSAAAAVTRLLWGRSVLRPTYLAANALFLRLLGLCYLAAFVSFWVQADGLVGDRGILPIRAFLDWVRPQTGSERYWLLPTLSWLAPGDAGLHVVCAAGVVASVLLVVGLLPALAAFAAWLCYLSVAVSGQIFLEFQWDMLLLEVGLLAVFLAPPRRARIGSGLAATALSRFLLVWLLFRLMLSSGIVKLSSGDPTWRNLTALRYHYETQCLPPWTAWFLHQLPPWILTLQCALMFVVELVVPFFFFAPRRLRLAACGLTVLLQASIAATGNYAFFNWLTIALCVLLIDDESFPRRWREAAARAKVRPGAWPRWILVPAAVWLLAASSVPFLATLGARDGIPAPLIALCRAGMPLRSANGYGLFAVMTTSRPEIVIEGSDDGESWRPYAFRWKPGDPARRPAFVAPHQPRLDWQMWFAALGSYEENPWLIRFLQRMLEGSPDVRRLLAETPDPFPKGPPRFVRAVVYDYHFTTAAERARTGAWWKRERKGLYCPVLRRESGAADR
jgi:lipase maturation factor 1